MVDITPLEKSLGQSLYCFAIYLLLVLIGSVYNVNYELRRVEKKNITFFLVLGLFVYTLTNFVNGDYYHYYVYINNLYSVNSSRGLEPLYQHVALLFNNNYLLFRLFVWGLALFLYIKTIKRFNLSVNHTIFILIVCFFNTFSYARASLGMAIFFYGFSYFYVSDKHPLLGKILGIAFMIASIYFHRSMYILLGMFVISYFVPTNKTGLLSLLCIFPILVTGVKLLFGNLLESNSVDDEMMASKMLLYSEAVSEQLNWKGVFQNLLQYSTYYVPLIMVTKKFIFDNKVYEISSAYVHLYKLTFAVIYLASIFLFVVATNQVFFYRILFMSMIPTTFLLSYLVDKKIIEFKKFKLVITLGVLYSCLFYMAVIKSSI